MDDVKLLMLGAIAFKKAAKEFLCSDLTDVGGVFLWNAYYYNICLAYELSLKCFLAKSNFDSNDLKEIGHDLLKGYNKAVEKGFQPHSENVYTILKTLSPVYKSHQLRYLRNEPLTLPTSNEQVLDLLSQHITSIAMQVGLDIEYAKSL